MFGLKPMHKLVPFVREKLMSISENNVSSVDVRASDDDVAYADRKPQEIAGRN